MRSLLQQKSTGNFAWVQERDSMNFREYATNQIRAVDLGQQTVDAAVEQIVSFGKIYASQIESVEKAIAEKNRELRDLHTALKTLKSYIP